MFRKFITKLVLLNIIFLSLSLSVHSAETDTESAPADPIEAKLNQIKASLGDPLEDAGNDPCIRSNKGEPDEGYIITIIEEPLNAEPLGKTAPNGQGDDYVSRICYRNYFAFSVNVDGKKRETSRAELSTICSKTGQASIANQQMRQEFNIRFSCQQVQVLLTRGGTAMIEGYINNIYRWAASVIGLISVAVIIISGVQISLAGGDSTGVDEAKKRIIQSLLAIALLFLSGVILNFINPNFFTS